MVLKGPFLKRGSFFFWGGGFKGKPRGTTTIMGGPTLRKTHAHGPSEAHGSSIMALCKKTLDDV